MCSDPVMILKIARQDAAQVTLVEDDDVIQTFAADRADGRAAAQKSPTFLGLSEF
jgi:hypothetical protein